MYPFTGGEAVTGFQATVTVPLAFSVADSPTICGGGPVPRKVVTIAGAEEPTALMAVRENVHSPVALLGRVKVVVTCMSELFAPGSALVGVAA